MHGANVRLASSHPEAQELKYCGWYNITSLHTKPDADCMWKMQSWLLWNSVEMGKSPRRRKVIYLEDILHVLRLEKTRIQSLLFGWSQSMNYLNQRTWCSALFYQSLFRFLIIYTPTLQLKNNQQCIFSSQWRKINIIFNVIIMTKKTFLIADFNVDWGTVPLHNFIVAHSPGYNINMSSNHSNGPKPESRAISWHVCGDQKSYFRPNVMFS